MSRNNFQQVLRWFSFLTVLATVVFALPVPEAEAAEPLWQQLTMRRRVDANPNADYTLTESNGPWLILASSFSGEGGEKQARDLVFELRKRYSLPAYYYGMTFQLNDGNVGRGLDKYGSKIRRRLQRGDRVVEHAVLVGEFPSVDDPAAQRLLEQIKTMEPDVLEPDDGETSAQSLANVRQFQKQLKQKIGKSANKGPMGHAFLTRNPLLPREFFVPKGVDDDVAKWNKGLEYSLLECPGKFSIKVATFQGRSTIKNITGNEANESVRTATDDDPLVVAARNAHLLAVALREKGWEAYEFHDRYESYVTVGSFDHGDRLADGRIILSGRNAQIIVDTFGARSPNNVLNKPAMQDRMLEQQRLDQFKRLYAGSGQVAEGFHPKRFVGLPFDIIPEPIEVPKQSISAAYVRN